MSTIYRFPPAPANIAGMRRPTELYRIAGPRRDFDDISYRLAGRAVILMIYRIVSPARVLIPCTVDRTHVANLGSGYPQLTPRASRVPDWNVEMKLCVNITNRGATQ